MFFIIRYFIVLVDNMYRNRKTVCEKQDQHAYHIRGHTCKVPPPFKTGSKHRPDLAQILGFINMWEKILRELRVKQVIGRWPCVPYWEFFLAFNLV